MEELFLSFEANRILGTGKDMVGPFTLSGTIGEGGAVVMHKHYLGQHSVQYAGIYDGEGTMSGEWSIDFDRGPWLITIRRAEANSQNDIVEFVPSQVPHQE